MTQGAETRAGDITGLTCDSRQVEPGFLFAALPGTRTDGRAFIAEAVKRGAAAVLTPPGAGIPPPDCAIPLLIDDNPRRRFALMAARFFSQQPSTIAAVTGTNGKTSVVSFARQIWRRQGRKAASMGTLGVAAPGLAIPGSLTTPDPVQLHKTLHKLAGDGIDCLAMEASSHGLDQYRLDGVRVSVAAFTNLGRDHLDYHGSMAAYLDAKKRLFADILKPGGAAVINADSDCFDALREIAKKRGQRVIGYGRKGAEIGLLDIDLLPGGQRLRLMVNGVSHAVNLPLAGAFQAENALCALGVVIACGGDSTSAVAALETLEGVPGRLQKIAAHHGGADVFVDFAHTPEALANVLTALRRHARGRLAVVFGCGGDRDPGKRAEMGRIACALADDVIVTDDNPRSEDPAAIRRQILSACAKAREIGNRAEAIKTALAELTPDGLLVVAGKGHETGQIVGDKTLPFNDAEVIRAALGEMAP